MSIYLKNAIKRFLENVDVRRFFEEKVYTIPSPEQLEQILAAIKIENGEVFINGVKLNADEPGLKVGDTEVRIREYAHKQYILFMSTEKGKEND